MAIEARHVFGPVPSRRLGRSLGVDVVPYKTCSYDCIYCQLGPTTNRTVERKEYVSNETVLREVEARLREIAPPDFVTLSGSGEPTLHTGLAALVRGIRRLTDRPVAVLTNGSLLWRSDVQEELADADLVMPSLDAGQADLFEQVNRPHPQLRFEQVVDGLVRFRRRFGGQLWLEVFLLSGVTANEAAVVKIRELAAKVQPDRIQLNTVARPPTESVARAASVEELAHAATLLGERAEVIIDHSADELFGTGEPCFAEIVAMLGRRPCTLDDLATGLGAHRLTAAKHLEHLLREHVIVGRQRGSRTYYQLLRPVETAATGTTDPTSTDITQNDRGHHEETQ